LERRFEFSTRPAFNLFVWFSLPQWLEQNESSFTHSFKEKNPASAISSAHPLFHDVENQMVDVTHRLLPNL